MRIWGKNMEKRILIGSIIAVVLLVLVSFTSVVGYSSVKSDSKIESPLFGIRTNKAINNKQDAVTSDYIGKGKAINILLPKRNDKALLIEKFVNFIQRMDEKSFNKLLSIISKDDRIKKYDILEQKELLNRIRNNEKVMNQLLAENNAECLTSGCIASWDYWSPGCYILRLINAIEFLFIIIQGLFFCFLGLPNCTITPP